MPMDTKRVREFLRVRHEVDEGLPDLNLSNLAAVQTALLCDIADSLREAAARNGADELKRLAHQMGMSPSDLQELMARMPGSELLHRMREEQQRRSAEFAMSKRGIDPRRHPLDHGEYGYPFTQPPKGRS